MRPLMRVIDIFYFITTHNRTSESAHFEPYIFNSQSYWLITYSRGSNMKKFLSALILGAGISAGGCSLIEDITCQRTPDDPKEECQLTHTYKPGKTS